MSKIDPETLARLRDLLVKIDEIKLAVHTLLAPYDREDEYF